MTQLEKLKLLLGSPNVSDDVLNFYLDCAKDVICDRRNADSIEAKYLNLQLKMAVEMFNKAGAEGQTSHSENSIARVYDSADVSDALLDQCIPMITTPYSTVRVIV